MTEKNVNRTPRRFKAHHRGRGAQVWIYLGKLLLQCGYPVPDQTTVCLQLFLTRASGSDSSSKSRKRRT